MNGGCGDPEAPDQHLREMDQATFRLTQVGNIRIAVLSAFVGSTLGGMVNAFVSVILLKSSVCSAKTVLPQCARYCRALLVALSPPYLVQPVVSHTGLIPGQIRVECRVADNPAKAKVHTG